MSIRRSMVAMSLLGAMAPLLDVGGFDPSSPRARPDDLLRLTDKERRTQADIAERRARQEAKLARRAKRAGK